MDEETKKKLRRPMGAVLVLLAGFEVKLFMLDVLDKFRQAHDSTISYSEKGLFLPPLTLGLGLLLLFASDAQVKGLRNENRKLTRTGWFFVIVMLVMGFGLNEWFKGEVKKLGYDSADTLQLRHVDDKPANDSAGEK